MNPWAWIAAYVVGFALLQLLVYRYLGRKTGGTASPAAPEAPSAPAITPDVGSDDTVTCEDCGAVNAREPGYRYCRECAATLR
jgi:hypothetical protein